VQEAEEQYAFTHAEGSMKKLMSVQEVAEHLGVSLWTVYRLARAHRLASVQLGKRRLFTEEDVEELVKSSRASGGTPGNNKCPARSS
jgi:excisionase family DNA binding protein